MRLDVDDAPFPQTSRICWSSDGCGGADAHGCEVLFVDAGHDPDRGQVGNGKEFLRRTHNQSKICGAGKHYSVDRRRHDKVRINLFGLLERGDLLVAGTQQLQLFEGRTYIRFMTGMHRLHVFLFLLAGGSELDQVLRAHHKFFVVGFQLGQVRKILCFRLREFAAEDHGQGLPALDVVAKHHGNLLDDTANKRSDMHLAIFVRVDDSGNAKRGGGLLHVHMDGLHLRLLQIVGAKLDL